MEGPRAARALPALGLTLRAKVTERAPFSSRRPRAAGGEGSQCCLGLLLPAATSEGQWPRNVQGLRSPPTVFAKMKTLFTLTLLRGGDGIGIALLGCKAPFIALRPHSCLPPTPQRRRDPRAPPPASPRGESPLPPALRLPSPFKCDPGPLAFLSQARYVYLIIELLKDLVSFGP